MGVNTTGLLNTQTEVYASYKNDAVTKNETAAKKDSKAKTEEKNESGVVYDKSDSSKDNKKATYSINKMSAEDRAALVQQMKADTQSRRRDRGRRNRTARRDRSTRMPGHHLPPRRTLPAVPVPGRRSTPGKRL